MDRKKGAKMDFINIFRSPKRFEESPNNIWTNEKLSSFIFHSHFDENIYGGSKSKEFIDNSLSFIEYFLKEYNCKQIIDLGCGPGIYTQPLAKLGYKVTGVDISNFSIEFARKEANKNNLDIQYINEDFFNIDQRNKADMILMLYEIYSSFDLEKRKELLDIIYNLLREEMIFIFDVPLRNKIKTTETIRSWKVFEKNEFYNDEAFAYFVRCKYYGEGLFLNHSIFLYENSSTISCFDWVQHFTLNQIIDELKSRGFKILGNYSDISGNELEDNSSNVALICQKN